MATRRPYLVSFMILAIFSLDSRSVSLTSTALL
ncbi:hypothetical protein LSH36_1062g00024 [Paralvinella palmiformis]|uniref:Uncharacterized protein n=1 Tax=Paralvinella palmiformis TaxID=53620 RepID=A0AAD9IVE1_9ANNE|nr:hypothetical protein LSH36_1062g00024 [Paralvinella palmiformis]